MNLVDTSGWLEYYFAGPNAQFFAAPIENCSDLLVPTVCLYEVFKKVSLVANESSALQAVVQMKLGQIAPLTETLAFQAASISIRYKLPMADSVIYATALAFGAEVWTQDEDFRDLPGVHYHAAGDVTSRRRAQSRRRQMPPH